MYPDEFKEYLEENCPAKAIFISKALDFLNEKNQTRKKDKRWSDARIEREAEIMWGNTADKLYDQIRPHVAKSPSQDYWRKIWIEFMDKHNVLAYFIDGVSEMEFN